MTITNNLNKEVYNYVIDNNNNVDNNNMIDNDNDDNDEIYEIKEDIKRVDTITFDKLDLMEYYEIVGIKNKHIGKHIIIIYI